MNKIYIYISAYTAHLNQVMYSLYEYSVFYKLELKVFYDKSVKTNCILIKYRGKSFFLDYSDDTGFSASYSGYDFYYKRSLALKTNFINVLPLNFQINISTASLGLLKKLPLNNIEFLRNSKVEILRMLDFLKLTNMNHISMSNKMFLQGQLNRGNGKILFCTRLWDPSNNSDSEEKERRNAQNKFRIEACKIIKENFKNSFTGIFDSPLARELCPDLIFKEKVLSKKQYFKYLVESSICIADDGLKDTPGWKIGEYVYMGKAVVSTPIKVQIKDFKEDVNYLKVSDRLAYSELPEKIEYLLNNNNFENMRQANLFWSKKYISPISYVEYLFSVL